MFILRQSLSAQFKWRFIEMNKKAFKEGIQLGKTAVEVNKKEILPEEEDEL